MATSFSLGLTSWTCSSKPWIFSNIAFSHVSPTYLALYLCSFGNCTFDSKPRHLACQISFSICSSRNLCSTFFKDFVTNSMFLLCLTNVVVNASSWQNVAFFISSTTRMSVPSTIAKFYYKAFIISLTSFSSFWRFSNFCWVIKFLIQLSLSKHEPYIIFFPLMLMGFKLEGINAMFNVLSFIQYYAL